MIDSIDAEIVIDDTMSNAIVNDGIIQDSIIDEGTVSDSIDAEEIKVISLVYSGEETDNIIVTINDKKISATLKQVQYETRDDFPSIGSDKLLYIDLSNTSIWFFDSKTNTYKEAVNTSGLATEEFVTNLLKDYTTTEELQKTYATNSRVNEVESIAKGANQAVSFGNYSTMITMLNALGNNVYNVGQNIMIVTLNVPDLWVSNIANTSVAYSYTTDEDFTNTLKSNGSVQVGYYVLSALETQKVDLTEYVKNTDYAALHKPGVVKTNAGYGVATNTDGYIYVNTATLAQIDERGYYAPITAARLDYAVKVGVTTNTIELTDEEKESSADWLGYVKSVTNDRCVYANLNGKQNPFRLDYSNTASVNSIPFRALNGAIMVTDESCEDGGAGAITDGLQAVNKNYVKSLASEKLTQDKSETIAVEVYGKNKNGELVMIPVGAYNYNSDFTEQSRLLMMNWADKLYFGTPAENSNEDLGATTYWVRRYAYSKTEVDDKIASSSASIPVRNFIGV